MSPDFYFKFNQSQIFARSMRYSRNKKKSRYFFSIPYVGHKCQPSRTASPLMCLLWLWTLLKMPACGFRRYHLHPLRSQPGTAAGLFVPQHCKFSCTVLLSFTESIPQFTNPISNSISTSVSVIEPQINRFLIPLKKVASRSV